MAEPISLLMIQFLEWVASRPRTYADAMDAWRTSCRRLSVWEDAQIAGLVQIGVGSVTLTPRGQAILVGNTAVVAERGGG
jgi:hypothetical protein